MCFISTTFVGSTVHFHVSMFMILAFKIFVFPLNPRNQNTRPVRYIMDTVVAMSCLYNRYLLPTYDGRLNPVYDEVHSIQRL